jgi:SAM-dependent methyltransferase
VATERYVPAAGRRAFTALYDPVLALTMREGTFRERLLDQVLAGDPSLVVDVGAGTGTFAIAAAARGVRVVAVDGDPDVLQRAARKPGAERVRFEEGLADGLPLDDATADRVVMSLLLHHLEPQAKDRALAEARRVLRPGGRLHLADWGRPRDPVIAAGFFALRLVDGFSTTADHAAGRLPARIEAAGFADVAVHDRLRTPWGSLELLSAVPAH